MENKKYYIYAFLDSTKPGEYIYENFRFEYEPFYIGKGTGDRINISSTDRESTFKVNKIKSIKKKDGEVIKIKILENLENLESLELEKSIIKLIGRRDLNLGPLANQTDGGDGRISSSHTPETKKKISETKKSQKLHSYISQETKEYLREINMGDKNPMYGKTHSDEFKETHSMRVSGTNHPMYGKKHSIDTINKIRENRNNSVNQDLLNRISSEINSKSVLQFNIDGSFISEYKSIKEASAETGVSKSVIGKNCRGLIKNPTRFIFIFKDEKSKVLNNSFLYKISDIIDGYTLVKRNKTTCIMSKDNILFNFRKKEHPYLWDKKKLE